MGSLSIVFPAAERIRVRAQAHRLYSLTREVSADPRLRRRVCRQVAAIAPQLAAQRLSLLARHALWCYRLDDRLDDPGADPAALTGLRDRVTALVDGSELLPGADPLLVELFGILVELSGYDGEGALRRHFAGAVRDAVVADLDHVLLARAVAAGTCPPPGVADYLAVAARTVNYLSFAYALLALVAGSLSATQLAAAEPALWHAAYAVRLGNDLRGASRLPGEDGLNVLWLGRSGGAAMTCQQVREEIASRVAAHDALLRGLVHAGQLPEVAALALIRCLGQSIQLYRHTDLR